MGSRLVVIVLSAAMALGTAGPGAQATGETVGAAGAGRAGATTFAFTVGYPWNVLPAPATPCPPEPVGCIFASPGSLSVVNPDGSAVTGIIVCAHRSGNDLYLDVRSEDGSHHTAFAHRAQAPADDVDRFGFAARTPDGCWDTDAQQAASEASAPVTGAIVFQGTCVETPDPPGPVVTDPCIPDWLS